MNFKILYFNLVVIIYFVDGVKKDKKSSIEKQLSKAGKLGDIKLNGLELQIFKKPAPAKTFGSLESPLEPVTAGRCDPKPVCIPNPLSSNPLSSNQIVFPQCVNIHRCGGCCSNNYECVASKTKSVNFKEAGIIDIYGTELIFNEEFIVVKNETECECRCPFQTDEDCRAINPNYIVDDADCGCVCPERLACSSLHQLDDINCKCVCNKFRYSKLEANCLSIGLRWDERNCRCIFSNGKV